MLERGESRKEENDMSLWRVGPTLQARAGASKLGLLLELEIKSEPQKVRGGLLNKVGAPNRGYCWSCSKAEKKVRRKARRWRTNEADALKSAVHRFEFWPSHMHSHLNCLNNAVPFYSMMISCFCYLWLWADWAVASGKLFSPVIRMLSAAEQP
jgi:hypothetical protein